MPPSNRPSWAGLLRTTALWPDRSWVAARWVSTLVATRELQGWLTERRSYEGQHKQGWLSAIADFERSTGQLGPDLRAALGKELTDATARVSRLRADFGSITPAPAMRTRLTARRTADKQALDDLSARWAGADGLAAAWSDLLGACRATAIRYETLAIRRDLFWQLVRAGNHDADQMSRHLAGALGGTQLDVALVKLWLGDIGENGVPRPGPGLVQDAGLTMQEQLALCQRILAKSPARGRYVVWIAFDHAGPGSTARLDIGRVSFWDCDWVRENLMHGGPHLDDIPGELKGTGGIFSPGSLPSGRDVRLARVDLGTGIWADPVRAATDQARAVVALAGFHVGDTWWRQMTGYVFALDDRVLSTGTFHPVRDSPDEPNDLYQSAMDVELADLAPKLQAHPPVSDRDLSETIQAVRWWQQAREQAPLASVLLYVRVLELLSQRAGQPPWQQYADSCLRAWWVHFAITSELGQVLFDCLLNEERPVDAQDRAWLAALRQEIAKYQPGSGYRIDLRLGYDALPDLVRVFPASDDLGRRVHSVVAGLTLSGLRAWRQELEDEWQLTRGRLARARNALAHGGPIEDDSAATVRDFAGQLAARSLSVALEGLLEGKDIATANDEHKRRGERWEQALATASSVTDAVIVTQ
jgi:hypothetical protein